MFLFLYQLYINKYPSNEKLFGEAISEALKENKTNIDNQGRSERIYSLCLFGIMFGSFLVSKFNEFMQLTYPDSTEKTFFEDNMQKVIAIGLLWNYHKKNLLALGSTVGSIPKLNASAFFDVFQVIQSDKLLSARIKSKNHSDQAFYCFLDIAYTKILSKAKNKIKIYKIANQKYVEKFKKANPSSSPYVSFARLIKPSQDRFRS